VNVKKLVGIVLVVFVLFWIITQPNNASSTVNNLLGNLKDAGESVVTFIDGVFS
jgi:hypothetical protein